MSENTQDLRAQAEEMLLTYGETRSPALRDEITRAFLYIADIVARRFARRGVESDDLYQVASLALVKAIDRFDASKGVKFSTFATPTMIGEVKNYFRDKSRLVQLPRRASSLGKRLDEARETLEQNLMRSPTAVELAAQMDVPLETVLEALEMRGAASVASLDETPPGAEESPMLTFLGEEDAGFGAFESRDQIMRALNVLTNQERSVIQERYFEGKSQREVADGMNVSQMTISRVERRALNKIRQYIGNN